MALAVLTLQGLLCGIWHFEPLRLRFLTSLHLLEFPQAIELPTPESNGSVKTGSKRSICRASDNNRIWWGASGWTFKKGGADRVGDRVDPSCPAWHLVKICSFPRSFFTFWDLVW